MTWKHFIRPIVKTLRNKYLLVFILFCIWMIFFDENNLWFLRENINKLKSQRIEREYYREKIIEDSIKLEALKSNSKNLEKFAREEFLMKKSDEDIFLIIEE